MPNKSEWSSTCLDCGKQFPELMLVGKCPECGSTRWLSSITDNQGDHRLFDIKRDIEFEKAGDLWCQACLVSHPLDDQSLDPRYCQGCYDFLLKEAEVLSESGSTRRPGWIPKPQKAQENQCPIPSPGASIMATVESPKIKVAIITPRDATRTIIKRGPKHRADLPVEFILKWAGEGMGSKKITAKLKAEYDITVGFRTIARILSGQRLLV